jgi:quercetin dioxygenase-like cupin family protein
MTIDQFHLDGLPEDHLRNVWQPATDDLHMNVLVLRNGEEIAPHVNQVLDVIVTCLRGSGTITIGDEQVHLLPGSIVLIAQGESRHITAGAMGMVYTTVHRKRGGLMPAISSR